MRSQSILTTVSRLLEAVEAQVREPSLTSEQVRQMWVWLGRALRALLYHPVQEDVEVIEMGNRLVGLVARVREKDGQEPSATLEYAFLSAVAEAASDSQMAPGQMTLSRLLKRDDARSLEAIADFFSEDLIIWDSSYWGSRNGQSEEDLCELLRRSDVVYEYQEAVVPLGVLGGATASLDAADPCGNGWLACFSVWPAALPWWAEYVRADLADVLARSAQNLDEAFDALTIMREVPSEPHATWSEHTRRLVLAGPVGVDSFLVDPE